MFERTGEYNELKERILHKLEKLPEDKLLQVDSLMNSLLGSEAKEKDIMRFAGAWKDMGEEWFDSILQDIQNRRRQDRRSRFDL